jgi:5'-deoxynucleotidase YfbR-like HD superfamily hydrolase
VSEHSVRRGDWQQTFTGRQFWALDPRPEDVCLEDIAHALSLQCRFAGHCREFYSVAEHSVRVSMLVEEWHADRFRGGFVATTLLAALLHDASEAYCVDVPRPLKPWLDGYKSIENGVMLAVEAWAGLRPGDHSVTEIKHADEVILATEARDLMKITRPWHLKAEPLAEVIRPWSSGYAEQRFLDRFNELTRVS